MKRITLALALALAIIPLCAMGAIKAEPPSELRPPLPKIAPPVNWISKRDWVLGGIAASLLAVLLLLPRNKPPVPPPDPFADAQRDLDLLRADAAKATPVAVSAIVRRFAAAAFGLASGAMTSEEIVSGLVPRRACPVELTNATWHFLSACDRAKFAPHTETPTAPELLANAAKLIEELEAARAKAARTL